MGNTPNVRFKGFTEDWKQRKLGDIADVTKLAGFEFTEHVVYSDEGNIIALRGLNIKNGQLILDDVKYIDGSNFSKLSRSKLFIDDIMFTYVGTVGEVAIIKENNRFYLAPNVSRIRVKSDDSPKFISHYMRTDNFKNRVIFPLIATSSQPALSMENIRKFTINIPINREEQDCLAKYFDSLDHLITLHQQKCDEIKELKKYMLQNMFPQKDEKVPKIRFAGFTGDWEQRKLGDSCKLNGRIGFRGYTEKDIISKEAGGVLTFSPTNIVDNKLTIECKNTYITREKYDESPEIKISNGDILFVKTGSTLGKSALVTGLKEDASINPQIVVMRVEKDTENFMSNVLITDRVMKQVAAVKIGGAVPTMTETELKNFTYFAPAEKEEKKKIGDYFRNLDHLITLHQQKCNALKEFKKYMLQNMFPQKGENKCQN